MRFPRAIALALLLGSGTALAETSSTLTLPEVFASVRANHPALAAATASTEAARARIDQEKAWADPRLGVDLKRDTSRLADYSELEVTVSQELPLSGRPRLRAAAARAEVGVASAQARRREWMLLNQARLTFTRLAAVDERLALNTRLHDNLVQTRLLARQAYETGQRSRLDLLSLETELATLDGERAELSGQRLQESAALNALMIRPIETVVAPLTLPAPAPPSLALPDAVARARAMSPDITVALGELDAAHARLAVVRQNRAIDPEVSVTGRKMRGMSGTFDNFDTGVAFSLPWANPGRTRAELTEARSRVTVARAELASAEAEIAGMVASAHTRAATTFARIQRYHGELLPLSSAAAETARRDYETGRAPLIAVLAAQRMTLSTEQQLADLRAEHALASSELCFLTSQDVQP
jgi:cobalt-zinc-cadmium efflux system outer membrane protein